ncbi:AAA family ATPase [Candidatus Gracilibacteria bacterium]|nr:AAA family ATPase [Candidatus Gracilibacteria bacterium]
MAKPISYGISKSGLKFFTPIKKTLDFTTSGNRMPSGITGFDKMIGGGFIAGSSILLSGPSGSGKTLFTLQSLFSALQKGYRASYISFEESRDQLIRNAESFGWDLEKYEKEGLLKLVIAQPEKHYPQEHLAIIRDLVKSFKPQLIVVDSMSAIENSYTKEIAQDWSLQLISLLKTNNITGIFTAATNELVGSSRASDNNVSSLFDQIIILRYVEIKAEFKHAILVLKMRGSEHDKKLYNMNFAKSGLSIGNSFSGYEGVFSGTARQVSESVEKRVNNLMLEFMGPMGQQLFDEEKEHGLSSEGMSDLVKKLGKKGVLSPEKVEKILDSLDKIFNSKKGKNT